MARGVTHFQSDKVDPDDPKGSKVTMCGKTLQFTHAVVNWQYVGCRVCRKTYYRNRR